MDRVNISTENAMITADDITDITLTRAGYYWEMGYNEFDFTCKIKGEDDVLHMREQRHDDGSGFVIRSEKDDIWEKIASKEACKLDDKLQEAIQYGNYHKRIGELTTLDDCKDMEFELMENNNVFLNRVLGKLWTELEVKQREIEQVGLQEPGETKSDIVSEFQSKTEKLFHKVDGQSAEDIEELVAAYVQNKIDEEILDADIVDVIVSGSRCRGLEKKNSDLDVVVEFKGSIRGDDLFNVLHEDGFEIAGIKIDINPITEEKSGNLENYLPGVEAYLREKENERGMRKSIREKIRDKELKISVNGVSTKKDKKEKIMNVR